MIFIRKPVDLLRTYLINVRGKAARLNATESYTMYVAGSMREENAADDIYEIGSGKNIKYMENYGS